MGKLNEIPDQWLELVIRECYSSSFSWEIREKLASWIEEREILILKTAIPNDLAHSKAIFLLLQEMYTALEKAPFEKSRTVFQCHRDKLRHRELLTALQNNIINMPLQYFRDLQACLHRENEIISRLKNSSGAEEIPTLESAERSVFQQVDEDETITKKIYDLKVGLLKLRGTLQVPKLSPNAPNSGITSESRRISTIQMQQRLQEVYEHGTELQEIAGSALARLQNFNEEQYLVALGKSQVHDLDKISHWWDGIFDCIYLINWPLGELSTFTKDFGWNDWNVSLTRLATQIWDLRANLIRNALVIELQPKPIIKVNTAVGHPVKLRVLSKYICIDNQKYELSLLYEKGMHKVSRGEKLIADDIAGEVDVDYRKTRSPDCTWNSIMFEDMKVKGFVKSSRSICKYLNTNGNKGKALPLIFPFLKINFAFQNNVVNIAQINDPKRTVSRSVMLEHFYILFNVTVVLANGEKHLLNAVSVRLAITTNLKGQKGEGWASILWELALKTMGQPTCDISTGLTSIHLPVTWQALIRSINFFFLHLGRGLSERNKDYLRKKLFEKNGDYSEGKVVTWEQFAEEIFVVSSQVKYSFWKWLWSCIHLLQWKPRGINVEEDNRDLWERGVIEGFIDDNDMRMMLQGKMVGTFMIRFPEKKPGSFCICYFKKDGTFEKFLITKSNLESTPIQRWIMMEKDLTNLFPEIPREIAFPMRSPTQARILYGYRVEVRPEDLFLRSVTLRDVNTAPEESSGNSTPKPGGSQIGGIEGNEPQGEPSVTGSHSFCLGETAAPSPTMDFEFEPTLLNFGFDSGSGNGACMRDGISMSVLNDN